eukprot:tig00021127_g18880.t1
MASQEDTRARDGDILPPSSSPVPPDKIGLLSEAEMKVFKHKKVTTLHARYYYSNARGRQILSILCLVQLVLCIPPFVGAFGIVGSTFGIIAGGMGLHLVKSKSKGYLICYFATVIIVFFIQMGVVVAEGSAPSPSIPFLPFLTPAGDHPSVRHLLRSLAVGEFKTCCKLKVKAEATQKQFFCLYPVLNTFNNLMHDCDFLKRLEASAAFIVLDMVVHIAVLVNVGKLIRISFPDEFAPPATAAKPAYQNTTNKNHIDTGYSLNALTNRWMDILGGLK